MIIALTGGIACGKSTVANRLAQQGWNILDTDHIAHERLSEDPNLLHALTAQFGDRILDASGSIDRTELGRIVFADPVQMERLNALVHPAVKGRVDAWIAEQPIDGRGLVMVPLLFETGWDKWAWDAIVCVTASHGICRQRLMERGWNEAEAEQRIAAQWPVADKADRSDYVISNDRDLKHLFEQLEQLTHALHEME